MKIELLPTRSYEETLARLRAPVRAKRERDLAVLSKLYDIPLPIGIEQINATAESLAKAVTDETIEVSSAMMSDALREFAAAGILTKRIGFRAGGQGRIAFLTVLVERAEAIKMWKAYVIEHPAFRMERTDHVALATDPTEEVRAIAGPEAPSPMSSLASARRVDDSEALVEAARQYRDRAKPIEDLINKYIRDGVQVDREAVLRNFRFKSDAMLDMVTKLLPVIERLERGMERVDHALQETRRRTADYDEVKRERDGLRKQVTRLIAERTGQGAS